MASSTNSGCLSPEVRRAIGDGKTRRTVREGQGRGQRPKGPKTGGRPGGQGLGVKVEHSSAFRNGLYRQGVCCLVHKCTLGGSGVGVTCSGRKPRTAKLDSGDLDWNARVLAPRSRPSEEVTGVSGDHQWRDGIEDRIGRGLGHGGCTEGPWPEFGRGRECSGAEGGDCIIRYHEVGRGGVWGSAR